jgi:hypothetical protein
MDAVLLALGAVLVLTTIGLIGLFHRLSTPRSSR